MLAGFVGLLSAEALTEKHSSALQLIQMEVNPHEPSGLDVRT
jgi:hypothetical protein